MPRPQKIATAALVGSGAAITGFYSVLIGESLLAKKAIGTTDERPPSADGLYGEDLPGEPLRCLVLGDSAAVGYGMTAADATPPAMVGYGLAHVLDRPVRVRSLAVVGAQTHEVHEQVDDALADDPHPDVAMIVIGTNDVTHQVPAGLSARRLGKVVRRLTDAGCEVVVGTCPDLGTVTKIKQPLRWSARQWSRYLAARQTVQVVRNGGRAVSLGGLLGPVFAEQPTLMFGADDFHPSETGYANMVSVLIPAMAAALREREVSAVYGVHVEPVTGHIAEPQDTRSMTDAAIHAAQHEGTEVTAAGRWASIRRRTRHVRQPR